MNEAAFISAGTTPHFCGRAQTRIASGIPLRSRAAAAASHFARPGTRSIARRSGEPGRRIADPAEAVQAIRRITGQIIWQAIPPLNSRVIGRLTRRFALQFVPAASCRVNRRLNLRFAPRFDRQVTGRTTLGFIVPFIRPFILPITGQTSDETTRGTVGGTVPPFIRGIADSATLPATLRRVRHVICDSAST